MQKVTSSDYKNWYREPDGQCRVFVPSDAHDSRAESSEKGRFYSIEFKFYKVLKTTDEQWVGICKRLMSSQESYRFDACSKAKPRVGGKAVAEISLNVPSRGSPPDAKTSFGSWGALY